MTEPRAIGRIGGNLTELQAWAKRHERPGTTTIIKPLGRGRWQIAVELPKLVEIGSKRKGGDK